MRRFIPRLATSDPRSDHDGLALGKAMAPRTVTVFTSDGEPGFESLFLRVLSGFSCQDAG
jgi:hypothetical protein